MNREKIFELREATGRAKRNIFFTSTLFALFLLTSVSCDKEPLTTIKVIESQIYNELKAHRNENGQAGPFVQQFVMVEEAQLFSAKMAFGTIPVGTEGIDEHWDIIHDKLGGFNDVTLVQTNNNATAAAIVDAWTSDSTINAAILGDLTQCGVGVEYDTANVAYITCLMMKAVSAK